MNSGKQRRSLDEQRLLDALFGEGIARRNARSEIASRPEDLELLQDLEQAIGAARRERMAVPDWPAERERALIDRILAKTTRAGPRRSRRAWRSALTAAGLLITASALLVFRPRVTQRDMELASVPPIDEARAEFLDAGPVGPPLRETLIRDREALATTASAGGGVMSFTPEPEQAPLEVRLLQERARGIRERRWAPWLREVSVATLDPLPLALWCEIELDRFVLSGDRPPAWGQVVGILERSLHQTDRLQESKLLVHAFARAEAYGLTDRTRIAAASPREDLWTPEWFADLEAAGREAGLDEARPWREWVGWRGRSP